MRRLAFGYWRWAILAFLSVALATMWIVRSAVPPPVQWATFTPSARDTLVREGRVVVVNYFGNWDANSRAWQNEMLFDAPEIRKLVHESRTVTMRADVSDFSDEIEAELKGIGVQGVPLIAVFTSKSSPIVMQGYVPAERLAQALKTSNEK